MSAGGFLLMFVGDEPGWLRIVDGAVVARGSDLAAISPSDDGEKPAERVALVVPGPQVSIHWAEIPPRLAPAQALGAGRIMASEVSAQPLDGAHVALGPVVEGSEERCLAIVDAALLARWLAEAQALGFDPDHVFAECLLLLPPEDGVRMFRRAKIDNIRGNRRAFAIEPELTAILLGDEPAEAIDVAAFEAGLAAAVLAAPVDLRQGGFAKRRRWRIDRQLVWRMIALGGFILLATLLLQLTLITKYSFAADAIERAARERARDVVPGNVEIFDPDAQLREAVAAAGGGASYGAITGAVFSAIRETADSELQSLIYAQDGSLQFSVSVASQADLDAIAQRMTSAGLTVTPGAVRDGGGRRLGEFTVRAP